MPTYEYQCSKGHLFEAEQSIHDPALKRCRVCRAKATRLISASSFILKGGGWYSDGYGSKGAAGKASSTSTTATTTSAPKADAPSAAPATAPASTPSTNTP
jgi:putative FmdB family regulatory protein